MKEHSDPFFRFFDAERGSAILHDEEWKNVPFKTYPHASRIPLEKPVDLQTSLQDALVQRQTSRAFSGRPLTAKVIGDLLFWSAGLIHTPREATRPRRPYPSGGSCYPVELYVVLRDGEIKGGGVFHYNVLEHALEELQAAGSEKIFDALPYDFAREAGGVVLLSSLSERTVQKYGSLGYKLVILEGGHIGQNICLVGTALGLGILAIGGMDYPTVHKELDLGADETVFYSLAIGWPA